MRLIAFLILPGVASCNELDLNPHPDASLPVLGESCSATSRCAVGYCDSSKTCATFIANGKSCTSSPQCASGFCFGDGICGHYATAGEACAVRSCKSGLYCDTKQICRPLRADGTPCTDPEQCLSGICRAQRCENRDLCAPFSAIEYPSVVGPCDLGVSAASQLVITTTDFGTGALSTAAVNAHSVTPDVALASTDAIPYYHDDLVYVVHRMGHDYIDLRKPGEGFALHGQFPVAIEGMASTNPHAVVISPDKLTFVTLFGYRALLVYDFGRPAEQALIDSLDLRRFADADGRPEASLAFSCGETMFVGVQRLNNKTFAPVDCDLLVAVNMTTRKSYFSPVPLLGTWARQARPDPDSTTAAVVLTTGIERVELSTGEVRWQVPETLFAAKGLGLYNLISFAISNDGKTFYVAANAPDFASVDIWRVQRTGPQNLEKVISGLNAIERTLEIIGDELWFADRTAGTSGVRVFDLSVNPPAEAAGPISTGLPPYSMVALP